MTTTVDGREVPDAPFAADPLRPLIAVLREDLGVTGPKQGCGIGRCGACLVLLDGAPAQACLTPGWRAAGRAITTVEGLAPAHAAMLTAALEAERAFQCGACAPGMVLALAWLLESKAATGPAEAVELLSGQICRCAAHGGLKRALAALLAAPDPSAG
jgi:carbon-monoxide dehydrogenase small subunit